MTEFEQLQIDWLKSIEQKLRVIAGLVGFGVTLYALKLLQVL